MNGALDLVYALAIIAAGILAWFGVKAARVPATKTKGVLMVVMALVLVGNVLIQTMPF